MHLQISARIARGRNVAVDEMVVSAWLSYVNPRPRDNAQTFHGRDPPGCHSEDGPQRAAKLPMLSGA